MSEETEPLDPLIGQRIGNYEITRRLGNGGMGVVYQGRHLTLDTDVAIKFLATHLAIDASYVERFLREARAAAHLHHPNLITVYDAGKEGDVYYMVMEFASGEDLMKMLREHRTFSEEEVIYLGIKAAEALGYAHQQGIIHRDIKPENIFLTNEGALKVGDLGLAKKLQDENASMTMSGMVVGTPFYISPEQVKGLKDVDCRTDIYSLGVTLFHLATGEIPFSGNSAAEIMSKHLTENIPDARTLAPQLSEGLSHVLSKMMAKEPKDRYQNMEEVCKALDSVVQGTMESDDGAATVIQPLRSLDTPTLTPKRVLRVPTFSPTPPASPVLVPQTPAPQTAVAFQSSATPAIATATPPPQPATAPTPIPTTAAVPSSSSQLPKIKGWEKPAQVKSPKKKSPAGRMAVAAGIVLLIGLFLYPKIKGAFNKAQKQIAEQMADIAKSGVLPLEPVLRNKIESVLSDLASKENLMIEGNTKFDLELDEKGEITSLKFNGVPTDALAHLMDLEEKGIRGAGPFVRKEGPSSWKGSLDISAKKVQVLVPRPLKPEEITLQNQLEQQKSRISQQIVTLQADLDHSNSQSVSTSTKAGEGLKGDFQGDMTSRFRSEDNGSSAADTARKSEMTGQIEKLKQDLADLEKRLASFQNGTMNESIPKLEFTVKATPSAAP